MPSRVMKRSGICPTGGSPLINSALRHRGQRLQTLELPAPWSGLTVALVVGAAMPGAMRGTGRGFTGRFGVEVVVVVVAQQQRANEGHGQRGALVVTDAAMHADGYAACRYYCNGGR